MKSAEKLALAHKAINAACEVVQKELGVTHGDVAGICFSDGKTLAELVRYINTELSYKERQ
jgi:hypothetical protein